MRSRSRDLLLACFMKKFHFFRRKLSASSEGTGAIVSDGPQTPINAELPHRERLPSHSSIVVPTFEQLLQEQQFSEAAQLLIERENDLFKNTTEIHQEDEKVLKLEEDRGILEKQVLQFVQSSFSLNPEDHTSMAPLISAVGAITLDEKQDLLWEHRRVGIPAWRPCRWRMHHDSMLRSLIEDRIDNPCNCSPIQLDDHSSIRAEIQNMGRQMKEDLLLVVKVLKKCYPPSMDICNFYASQYHQIFSARLRIIAEFGLDDMDCTFLLRWVNEFYPRIFQKQELADEIKLASLSKLLSPQLLDPLVEQYLSKMQTELNTFNTKVLEEEKENYDRRMKLKMEDGCYVSSLAIDIIELVNGGVSSAQTVTGDLEKAQELSNQLTSVLQRFKVFQEKVVRQYSSNSKAQIKAHLGCIEQFRDVLIRETKRHLFSEVVREECLSILMDMKQSAHEYLLNPVHRELKPHYQKLGTSEWLNNKNQFNKLLKALEEQIHELQGSTPTCHQELMGRLHQEVTREYVTRLLRADVKLKDKERQHKAYETVMNNAESLQHLFTKLQGSQNDWLKEILTKIAEVLKLQDVPAIQIQIAQLGSAHPDFSERHVISLLKLKPNLSKADQRTIRDSFSDALKEVNNRVQTSLFFSKVK
ncbi:tumor necrosis factor alpha-induced protein 2-like [Gouania willdenowi]|uniref:Tumor necrosis factor alpha-induced protein 2 n=1 Tax=Gouania willdenowi TaxID=441366 RepID=A0A8C5HQ14_GOUWI|nr:tumor necrosis factor alpha-induced protein 2 [Gouania willdenowi]